MRARFTKLFVILLQNVSVRASDGLYIFDVWWVFIPGLFATVDCVPNHFNWVNADLTRENFVETNACSSVLNRTMIYCFLDLHVDKLEDEVS